MVSPISPLLPDSTVRLPALSPAEQARYFVAEFVLRRWCEAHAPNSEARMVQLTELKQRLLAETPGDVEYVAFARRFREEAAKLEGAA